MCNEVEILMRVQKALEKVNEEFKKIPNVMEYSAVITEGNVNMVVGIVLPGHKPFVVLYNSGTEEISGEIKPLENALSQLTETSGGELK